MPKKTSHEIAREKLAGALAMVSKKRRAMKRLATSLRFWENRAAYYSWRASMTDAEVAAERVKRLQQTERRQAATARRGISMETL